LLQRPLALDGLPPAAALLFPLGTALSKEEKGSRPEVTEWT
jgi:hypothetical protein